MSYGYKNSELYQNYNQKREPTVEELHEMLLNMKFGVEDLYVDEIFANEAVISKIQSDIVLTTELRAEHIRVGSLSEFSNDLGTIETGILKTVVLEGATGTFSGEVSGGVIYADGINREFLFTNAIDVNPRNAGVHVYIRPTGTGEGRITRTSTLDEYRPIRAREFITDTSLRENKRNIDVYDEDILDYFRTANVYLYNRVNEITHTKKQLGMMIDELPYETYSERGDGFGIYNLVAFLFRGLKQTIEEVDVLKEELENSMVK